MGDNFPATDSQRSSESVASAPLVASLLLLSGACALIYQVVWMRELRLMFGGTTAANAAVVAVFMAGVGLGNAILGSTLDRCLRPLRMYATFEICVAISVAISPLCFEAANSVYTQLGGQETLGTTTASIARVLITALLLGLPTFFMGGTLPMAALAVSRPNDRHRSAIAAVYGLNTFGAVLGAAVANFYLIEQLGNRYSLLLASAVNLVVAVVSFFYAQRLGQRSVEVSPAGPADVEELKSSMLPIRGGLVQLCVISSLVGFVFFLMELVWYRMLGPLLGGTTYTFGLILCVALLGIGIGGIAYRLLGRFVRLSLATIALFCAIEALCIALPYWWGDQLAILVLRYYEISSSSFVAQVCMWTAITSLVILPASAIAGFQVPLMIAVAGSGRQHVARQVGWIFAANTLGAIVGSISGGFLLLPAFTATGLWRIAVVSLIVLSVAVALLDRASSRRPLLATLVAASLALLAIFYTGPTAAWRHSGIGAGRATLVGDDQNAARDFIHYHRRQCLWEAEGIESSIGVMARDSLAFMVNGKSDGNAFIDSATQIGLGIIGPVLHPNPKNALVIGLGTGESAGWLAAYHSIENVVVIELEPEILRFAEQCSDVNHSLLTNPKATISFNDAREYLITSQQSYDLIVSEPSNPYRAGVANLYTREFYRSVARRLNEDGLFVQWLQAYEADDRTIHIVLSTLRTVFPEIQIWRSKSQDLLLVCGNSTSALKYDRQQLEKSLQDPILQDALRLAWRVTDVEGIAARFVCGQRTVDQILAANPAPQNTDDKNQLEYAFAKSVGTAKSFSLNDVQSVALRNKDFLPNGLPDLDSSTVLRRQLAMELVTGGEFGSNELLWRTSGSPAVSDAQATSLEHLIAGYRAYTTLRYQDAVNEFGLASIDSTCPVERLVLAHSLAETGNAPSQELLSQIRQDNVTESHAINAILALQSRDLQKGSEETLAAFQSLRNDPWPAPSILYALLRYTSDIGGVDRGVTQQLFDVLEYPFALYRIEDRRVLLRYVLSEHLRRGDRIEALEPLEPYVPWKSWFLERRAQIYAEDRNPLFDAARRDHQKFLKWSSNNRS